MFFVLIDRLVPVLAI